MQDIVLCDWHGGLLENVSVPQLKWQLPVLALTVTDAVMLIFVSVYSTARREASRPRVRPHETATIKHNYLLTYGP